MTAVLRCVITIIIGQTNDQSKDGEKGQVTNCPIVICADPSGSDSLARILRDAGSAFIVQMDVFLGGTNTSQFTLKT